MEWDFFLGPDLNITSEIPSPNLVATKSLEDSKVTFDIKTAAESEEQYLDECQTYNLRVSNITSMEAKALGPCTTLFSRFIRDVFVTFRCF